MSKDLVHMRHRGFAPTALRLSPLQFRVLKTLSKGAVLKKANGKRGRADLIRGANWQDQRLHLATYQSLVRRELVAPGMHRKYGLVYVTTLLADAALEVYEL